MTGLRKKSQEWGQLLCFKNKPPAGLRRGNPLERRSEREAGALTHTTKFCIQSIFLWVLDRGMDKAKKTPFLYFALTQDQHVSAFHREQLQHPDFTGRALGTAFWGSV